MKRLALFAIVVYIGSSTVVNTDGDNYFAIIPKTCTDEGVGISTTPVPCVQTPPAVSTGPVIMESPIDGSCTLIDFTNPNNTCHATQWIKCPN